MTKTVTAFACSFHKQSKLFTSERSAARHELMCIHNPATKSCPTCAHDGAFCRAGERLDGEYLRRFCEAWQDKAQGSAA